MARIALISGSLGARADVLAAELRDAGWVVRTAPFDGGICADLAERARGAEAVFHLGVRTSRADAAPDRAQAEATAAYAVGIAARDAGARRFVLVSTASVYGRPRNLPCDEGELKAPRTPAERARWKAEQAAWLAFRHGAPLTVLRPTIVYGPNLRGGAIRALSFLALLNQGRRSIPIIRRGPVAHLVHIRDVARAAVHVAQHPHDADVVGRAFNVGDDAPLPLAEHLAAAVSAMGFTPGRVVPYSPRLAALLLWLVRSVPDRILVEPLNRRLAWGWERFAGRGGRSGALVPHIDREALHWMAADHYYDIRRLGALGWRPEYPISVTALPETVRAMVESHLLPQGAAPALLGNGPS